MCQYANWLRYVYAVPSRRRSLTHYHIGTLLSVKQLEGEFATNFLILPVCKAGKHANWLIGCAMFMLRHHALVIDTLAH